jgi:uncharacterized membrane protein AbrB (regulator of aidB expression)
MVKVKPLCSDLGTLGGSLEPMALRSLASQAASPLVLAIRLLCITPLAVRLTKTTADLPLSERALFST